MTSVKYDAPSKLEKVALNMAAVSHRDEDGKDRPNQAGKFASKIMRGEVALGDPVLARDYQVSAL